MTPVNKDPTSKIFSPYMFTANYNKKLYRNMVTFWDGIQKYNKFNQKSIYKRMCHLETSFY